jgi:hypothetical protein
MKNQENSQKWTDIKLKWIWNIWNVDESKLAVEIALFSKNPELIIGNSQHLLIQDKKLNVN